jgi:hypothetical protein
LKFGKLEILRNDSNKLYYIHEGVRSRLNLGNACFHSAQNVVSSHILSTNLKVEVSFYVFL